MSTKRRRTPALGVSTGSRHRTTGRADSRPTGRWLLLLVGASVVVVGAIAVFFFFGLGRGGPSVPVAWATLNTADVHALAFASDNPQHLYFGHHDGLLESRDGGRAWQPASLSGSDAMNVKTAAGGRIQIAGHDVFLESTDGGASWQPVPNDLPGLDLHAFAVDPADPDHAWTFAVGFGLFETTNAGRQWELRQPDNWGYLTAYRDGDRTALVAVGPEGLVRSLDAGGSWEPLAYPGAPLAGGLAAAADGTAMYAATSAGLRRSTDQGQTWGETGFDGVALAVAIAPDDPMDVLLVDDATRFYRSPDGGATWPAPARSGVFDDDPARLAAIQPSVVDWLAATAGATLASGLLLAAGAPLKAPSTRGLARGSSRGNRCGRRRSVLADPSTHDRAEPRLRLRSALHGPAGCPSAGARAGAPRYGGVAHPPRLELRVCADEQDVALDAVEPLTDVGDGATLDGFWLLPAETDVDDTGLATLPSGALAVPPGDGISADEPRLLVARFMGTGRGDYILGSVRLYYRAAAEGSVAFGTSVVVCSGRCEVE